MQQRHYVVSLQLLPALQEIKLDHEAEPGDPVIVPAPVTQADAEKRAAGAPGHEVTDWYLTRKKIGSIAAD